MVCDDCVSQFAKPHSRCQTCALPVPQGMPHCGACLKTEALRVARVVLVDDVMATAESLYAAARVLRAAGANHITGLVFSRTE